MNGKLASNFVTLAVPAWDNEITKIAYSIKQSKLTYSQFNSSLFGNKETMILQAYLMNKLSPNFSKIPFKQTKPNMVLKNNSYLLICTMSIEEYMIKLNKTISSKKRAYLENWDHWINHYLNDLIEESVIFK